VSKVWFGIIFIPLSFVSPLILYVCYNCYDNISIHLIMFFIIMFMVYFDYMLSIVGLFSCSCISSYNSHSRVPWVSGQHCVSVMLICCLPADIPYIPGHVVDRGCGTPVESFVVHSSNIGMHVGSGYEGRQALFLIFLSNIPYV
jgi:hypothetical protein